ncbi:hypothetical protein MAPG_06657 [Magnaporthiopsis poae ATCC 64411]|uniref:Uncharacterized protein n=1 Tax=Magnaporthiopsis poae (strain ATCC 64411 / 73-15) TaxID=644358 RepID=A0A0C4E2L6_MAGP6|nr:hypothetical protein MAPG_06657 [Magnaporthiopsis poae ATCC 64411]
MYSSFFFCLPLVGGEPAGEPSVRREEQQACVTGPGGRKRLGLATWRGRKRLGDPVLDPDQASQGPMVAIFNRRHSLCCSVRWEGFALIPMGSSSAVTGKASTVPSRGVRWVNSQYHVEGNSTRPSPQAATASHAALGRGGDQDIDSRGLLSRKSPWLVKGRKTRMLKWVHQPSSSLSRVWCPSFHAVGGGGKWQLSSVSVCHRRQGL